MFKEHKGLSTKSKQESEEQRRTKQVKRREEDRRMETREESGKDVYACWRS